MMSRVAILKIGYGNFQKGFEVSLEIKQDGGESLSEIAGKLPANKDIEKLYGSWQQSFEELAGIYRNNTGWDIDGTIATNVATSEIITPKQDCQQKVRDLETRMESWLEPSADLSWQRIREKLAKELECCASQIRLLIKAKDKILWKLPWHVWDLLSDYPDVGIGYSSNEFSTSSRQQKTHNQVRILAVFGNSQDIDLEEDKQAINNLTQTKPNFLSKPTATKFIQTLREDRGWNIFFFAGHSHSNNDIGRIYINEEESLTIEQFKNALTEAISNGLKIAIFNSCDGLALAEELSDLNIPVVIIMQEIVPDIVAQSFLKEFLTEYQKQENSLYTAVRRAQARLEAFTDFPGATLLPLILQNPATIPPRWQDFTQTSSDKPLTPVFLVVLKSLIVSAIVLGIRWLGLLQPLELYVLDRLIQFQTKQEKPDSRILIVTIDKNDIEYQNNLGMDMGGSSLSDEALNLALDKLESINPATIALDIYRENGFTPEVTNRLKADKRFYAICKIQEFTNNNYSNGKKPPPEIPPKRLIFSDVPVDKYDIVRRQFLDMTSLNASDPCNTQYSLSFLIAQHYLFVTQKIQATYTSKKEWQLGNIVLKKLKNHHAGYHTLDDSGYQLLLKYRRGNSLEQVAQKISLETLIKQGISPGLKSRIQEPIILIGNIDEEGYKDYHFTPYNKKISGVFLHAHMISQIISAVLDNRSLLWYWNPWIEAIYIWSWSIVGGLIAINRFKYWRLLLNIISGLIGIFGICFVVFTYSGWIPLIPTAIAFLTTLFLVKENLFTRDYK